MISDVELLREYAEQGSETAFAELVRRYLNLVYATALRLANGDAALAEDVTQSVFTDLARKAAELRSHSTLAGWLHTSAYYATAKSIRGEQRRRRREQEASTMNETTTADAENCWTQMRPVLDEAVNRLGETERNAVLLRFFQEKSYREIGQTLGVSEDAARMRIERGLEKLRDQFARRGVVATVTLLTTALGAKAASVAAPNTLAAQVVQKSWSNTGATKAGGVAAKYFGPKTTVMLAGATAVTVAIAATVMTFHHSSTQPASIVPAAVVAKPLPVVAKTLPNPNPPMNTTQVLTAGALAATLMTATPAAATTTNQLVSMSQNVAASTVQQTSPSTDTSSTPTTDNGGASTAAPQSTDSPAIAAAAISHGPVGIAQWGQWGRPINTADPGTEYSTTPVLVKTDGVLKGKTVTAIAGGDYFKLALCSDGTLVAWGDNSHMALGNTAVKSSREPVLVNQTTMGKKKVIAIAAYGMHAGALCSDGTVYLWGYKFADGNPPQTGRDNLFQSLPTLFQPNALRGRKVVALSIGALHGLALCSDGALVCWGSYFDTGKFSMASRTGRIDLPLGTDFNMYSVAHVVNDQGLLKGKKIVAFAAGYEHNLVLCSDGTLAQWGDGLYGDATGDIKDLRAHPENYLRLSPVAVDTSGVLAGKTITAIATGAGDLVLCSDSTLAISDAKGSLVPVLVDTSGVLNGKTVTEITYNGSGFLVLCSDGTLAAWGNGSAGELGNGQSGLKYSSPEPVLVDETGVLSGKQILAITEGAVLFK